MDKKSHIMKKRGKIKKNATEARTKAQNEDFIETKGIVSKKEKSLKNGDTGTLRNDSRPSALTNVNIPLNAYTLLGCVNCNWKGDKRCPEFSLDKANILPAEGYCKERVNWIQTLSPHYEKMPSLDQWRRDFNLALQQSMIFEYKDAEKRLIDIYNTYDPDDALNQQQMEQVQRQISSFGQAWRDLSKVSVDMGDKQVARDQPKIGEIRHVHLTPENFVEMVNKHAIDITKETKVVDVEEEEENE